MTYLLLLASALALGTAAVRHLPLRFYAFEYVAMSVVVGLFGWTWLAFLAALVLPLVPAIVLTTVLASAGAAALAWPLRGRPWGFAWFARRGDPWLWLAATAGTVAVLAPLYWRVSLTNEGDGIYSGGSSWADYGVHSAIVTHIAESDSMPTDLPVASGEKLTYPFLIDLLSALLLRSGASLHTSFFLPGVLLALAICQLVIGFSLRLFDHLGAAVTTLSLFLCTGTALGATKAWSDWRDGDQGLLDFLTNPPQDYTTLFEDNGNVTNLVAHAMLPQRTILFGLGVALVVFRLLQASRIGGASPISTWLTLIAGATVGLLPMAHPHSFLVCLGVLLVLATEAAWERRGVPRPHVLALSLALGLALPQLAWQQLANDHGTGGRFRWAWMKQPGESVLDFWWVNFGVMGLLFLAVPLVLIRRREIGLLVWCVPFLAVLAVTQVYAFQPFEYDNLKLIYYAYFMGALFAGYLAVLAYRASRWSLLLAVPVAIAVSLPGALSITRQFHLHDQFASLDDEAVAAWVRDNTEPDDVFLTTDRPNNPISALGGRPIVLGYPGWLFNFSIPYGDRTAAAQAALAGRTDDPLVTRYGPDYLAVQANEGHNWTVDRAALGRLTVAFTNPGWTVYKLS
ncbi:hypothetical protein [Sporichthya sp.]|uniref:hypothetical protein n=1 Tax=Sporichthya sp. TaxID=65475 RepID=UPI001792358E|nr:hypothetical protein [Sporichthya sp.]MBA3743254.1 hypothetical protein [Sporichthya sp.]